MGYRGAAALAHQAFLGRLEEYRNRATETAILTKR